MGILTAGWTWVCFSAYFAGAEPQAGFSERSVLTRPRPEDFRDAADAHVLAAVAVLQDRSLDGETRLDAYAREAVAARTLYAASLEGRSHQPLTVARLAALRFEEDPPLAPESWTDWSTTLDLAAGMAPRTASVHASLGELLVRMGRAEEGLRRFATALTLDPSRAAAVTAVMDAFGVPPETAVAALPRSPDLLLALRRIYEREERFSDYADLLEEDIQTFSADLLAAWADARLAAREADRIVASLESRAAFGEPEREAARCVHLSRAHVALGDIAAATDWASRARSINPGDPRALEQSAHVALGAADPQAAIRFCREALTALAQRPGTEGSRARVYEVAGRAEEAIGRMDLAHDAYSRALALDPDRTTARRRLEAMRAAAGLVVPSGAP